MFELPVDLGSVQPENVEERHSKFVFFTFFGTEKRDDGQVCDCGPSKLTGACNAVSPTKEALLQPLVSVGGGSGGRDVIYPIPGGRLLRERPVAPGGRERTEREEQLQRQVESDTAQRPFVKAQSGLDQWNGHLAARRAGYRGWCPSCVAGKGKSEAPRPFISPSPTAFGSSLGYLMISAGSLPCSLC